MRRHPIAFAIALVIAGCATPSAQKPPSTPTAQAAPEALPIRRAMTPAPSKETEFLYELLTPSALGLARVFDDGSRTYVLFETSVPAGLMVFDENGKALTFSEGDQAVLIDTVRRGLLLRTPTKSSFAQARTPERVARIEASRDGQGDKAWLPADLAGARAELLRAETKLSETSAALDRAAGGDLQIALPALKADLDEIQTTLNGLNATLVRTHFETGSASLSLTDSVKDAFLEAARLASQVRIRGRADATGLPETNLRLARERALSVRRLLVEGGIDQSKLHTSFARADYIASNATPEGRAENRRVDVLFVGAPVHVLSVSPPIEQFDHSVAGNAQTNESLR